MSIFSGIASADHTFVAWAEKELTKVEKAAPTIEKVVDTGIAYLTPVLNIALAATGAGAVVPEVDEVISEAQKDLMVVSSVIYDFGPTPTAASMFASIKTNLQGLLSAGHIKSATGTAAVNKAIGEVDAMGAAVSAAASKLTEAAAPATPAPAPAPAATK
jgi:hypothetical protein